MKFLLIHQAFATPREPGGTRHFEFARFCVAHGDEFVVLASDVNYLHGKAMRDGTACESLDGVAIHRLQMPAITHVSMLLRIVSYLCFMSKSTLVGWQLSRDVDVVIATTPSPFQAMAALCVAKLRRRPLLLEVRDLWPDFAVGMGRLRSKPLVAIAHALERMLYRHADRIIVNSPAYLPLVAAKGVEEARMSLVCNGVAPEMFDPNACGSGVRARHGLEAKFLVVYAGALGPANDIWTILESSQRVKSDQNIHFLIVGDGSERPHLEQWVKDQDLSNVTFTGTHPKQGMREVLAAADACVATLMAIPMFKTTFPNKVFDYMAAGRPTILAIDGVIREVIETSGGGVCIPPGDSAALASAVRDLKDAPQQRRTMGVQARRYVEANYRREQHAEQFRKILHDMARVSPIKSHTAVLSGIAADDR